MHHLIRIVVAILTFSTGFGLAGLVSPATKSRTVFRRPCNGSVAKPLGGEREVIDANWVFVEKDLAWYEVRSSAENFSSNPPPVVETAHAHLSIFYPSGKFAIVCCRLVRAKGAPTQIRFDTDTLYGYTVYFGNWEREGTRTMATVADESYSTALLADMLERDHLVQLWNLGEGEPSDQSTLRADGRPFVHLKNFSSLTLLSSVLAKAAGNKYLSSH
jgi:hypothetical protein